MATEIGPDVVTDGLVFHLDAANTKSYSGSGTTWTDLNSNYNGTLTNGPAHSSTNSGILSFDGSNDYVTMAGSNNDHAWTHDDSVGNNILCYEIWVKTTDGTGRLLSKPWNGNGHYNISVYPGAFSLSVASSASITLPTFNDGDWHQLIVWANSHTMGYYLDGASSEGSVSHNITSSTVSAGNSQLPLGIMTLYFYGSGWGGSTGHALSGDIGIFRKYNRVISSIEAAKNYNATKSRFI